MNNYLISEAIGDITGSAYVGSDTLAAIAGPMAYAYYKKMLGTLVYQALKKLPDWIVDVSEMYDKVVNKA